ncbi:hypothetical protein QVD17_34759 [Tagetes erecta]|uniref:Uncharacterized protein n=1 Tax=Tagetes erecta TaxID=13708 RepID=A0AAD8K0Y7_TARER|nr:hypothetical protein QVD17_34759 [Tagetes erecta]
MAAEADNIMVQLHWAVTDICNIPARRTMILSALAAGTPSGAAPHGFKTRHGRGGYHTLIKQCPSHHDIVRFGSRNALRRRPHVLKRVMRPRWHIGRQPGSDTICNIPARRTMILSALAAGTPSGAALTVLKRVMVGEITTPL